MDGVRSDDFAGLLAALGRSAAPTTSSTTQPANTTILQPTSLQTFQNQLQNSLPVPSPGPRMPQMPQMQQMQMQPPPQYAYPSFGPTVPYQGQLNVLGQQYSDLALQNQYLQQQLQMHETKPKFSFNPWIIGLLVLIFVVCIVVVWSRMTRVVAVEEEEDEKEDSNKVFAKDSRKQPREVPPPSSSDYYSDEDVGEYVAENLLNYVQKFESSKSKVTDEVDLTGLDLPFPMENSHYVKEGPSKRIVADDSPEVVDYAKRREALFKERED